MGAQNLHFFCGLIASGKSTLAQRIAKDRNAVLIAEDAWLSQLWPGEMTTLDDYKTRSRRLKAALWPHVLQLLAGEGAVVLDFAANTPAQRDSFRPLVAKDGVDAVLHHLDVPVDVCRRRLLARNAAGAHPFAPSLDDFDRVAQLFQPPKAEEGFTVRIWRDGDGSAC